MSRADAVSRGNWIHVPGVGSVKVTHVKVPGFGRSVEIDWQKGSKSGVLVRSPGLEVKRVFKPKGRQ